MTNIEREFVYPDLIKFWDDHGVVATAHRSYVDKHLIGFFEAQGFVVVPHKNNQK